MADCFLNFSLNLLYVTYTINVVQKILNFVDFINIFPSKILSIPCYLETSCIYKNSIGSYILYGMLVLFF